MFSFLFQHISHFSWKCDLSQDCPFARFCIDERNLHSFFFFFFVAVAVADMLRAPVVSQALDVSSFLSGVCAVMLLRAPQDGREKVAYFLRMSEGN